MSRPTIEDCVIYQGHLRRLAFTGDESALCSKPFFDVLWAAEHRKRHPFPKVPPQPQEPPVAPRPVITEHRVTRHTFSDGTIWESCTATDCAYRTDSSGLRPQVKRHTDRAVGIYDDDSMPFVTETEDGEGVEVSDDPQELSVDDLAAKVKPVVGEYESDDALIDPPDEIETEDDDIEVTEDDDTEGEDG